MVIENRNLGAGTILSGRYKGKRYECTVLESEGVKAYSLEDGSIHKSPSAAASKLMDGASVNGWRFWSLAAELDTKPKKAPKTGIEPTNVTARMVRVIKKVPNQKSVPEGSTKWWCSACMGGFVAAGAELPKRCPAGHARETPEDLGLDAPAPA